MNISQPLEHVELAGLVNVIQEQSGEARENALVALKNLSVSDNYKVRMAEPELGLLPLLVSMLKMEDEMVRVNALVICFNLSLIIINGWLMQSSDCSKQLWL